MTGCAAPRSALRCGCADLGNVGRHGTGWRRCYAGRNHAPGALLSRSDVARRRRVRGDSPVRRVRSVNQPVEGQWRHVLSRPGATCRAGFLVARGELTSAAPRSRPAARPPRAVPLRGSTAACPSAPVRRGRRRRSCASVIDVWSLGLSRHPEPQRCVSADPARRRRRRRRRLRGLARGQELLTVGVSHLTAEPGVVRRLVLDAPA